ncbi:esterase [Lithospermum erythrorhizon]|uniref:Pectinesterase n=1 Tax=Lithospermum erythrorhizon TaxID=34254 RepID=A0AAV3RZ60_LITER
MCYHSKEEEHAGILPSGNNNSSISNKRNKMTLFAVFGSLLIVASIIGLAASVASSKHQKVSNQHAKIELQTAHLIVKSSCESTLYPDLCYSSLADELKTSKPSRSKKIKNQKDVIEIALNITIKNVQQNQKVVETILNKHNNNKLPKRVKGALQDCLETIDETLDELHKAIEDLEIYPNKKSLRKHADDLKTLLSAAMTNPETCIDGFSHDEAAKKVREELLNGQEHIEKLCSNSLAMICNMTNTDIANEEMLNGRKLKEEENNGWPEWLSAGDRRLLQSTTVTPNVVVAADGSGNFKTISEAVNKAPTKSSKRYVIRIKAGVYRENVEVPNTKTNIMFVGDGKSNTIVTGSKNVVDGATTFNSATVGNYLYNSIVFYIFQPIHFF